MAESSDKSKPYIPVAGLARDGYSRDGEATATCFCGAVQLAFPTEGPGLVNSFLCSCTDCHKIHSSMFGANFTIKDTHLKHIRGRETLKTFAQATTIHSGNTMTNHFCSNCGTLMYRVGALFPGVSILRLGTVDDFTLFETKLKPRIEQWTKDRVSWFHGVDGAKKFEGPSYDEKGLAKI
ncbi:Mss4-like protein [Plectosphaerella cucumerina]|uniref:Mss4-like protein n=1 Tax=Plectosphaerella cucumerina TaxID=40658 RepID=A0A8K0X667_9PEZI|nr:Mss4-like protein [Plectosphaerella cucumerina]